MPKRPKSGPPYTDIPKEIYVVVTNPWGMHTIPRSRDQGDFDRVASWAQLVLQQAGLGGGRIAVIECIYSMGTRDEIILQFQEGTDIIPLLGEHRWAKIAKDWQGPPDHPRATRVFIYNWRNNGDPANHNWTENFPNRLPLDNVPAKTPYPAPSWTNPPSTLTNFVIPIPHPPIPPPMPNDGHNPGQEQQPATMPPPPTVTPSPAPPLAEQQDQSGLLNRQQAQCDEASSSRVSPPPPKFVKKLDPYELDEDALNALRSPDPSQEDTKDAKNEDIKPTLPLSVKLELPEVKIEDGDTQRNITPGSCSKYQPSPALIDALNSLARPEQIPSSTRPPTRDPRRRPNAASQIAPPASLGYQPSAELEAAINSLLPRTTATGSSSSSGSAPRSTSGTRMTAMKREYEEDSDVVASLGERKRIKNEEY